MSRVLALALVFATLAAACGGGEPATPESVPSAVTASWFEAVDGGDATAAGAVVTNGSLAVVLALENGLSAGETADLVESGVPLDTAAAYWSSFRAGFSEFAGRPMSSLAVGDYEEFDSEGMDYAAVTVSGNAGAETTVLMRHDADLGWQVDAVATLAPGFIGLMRRNYESLPPNEDGDRLRAAYDEIVVPALWAVLASGDADDEFTREALALLEAAGAS